MTRAEKAGYKAYPENIGYSTIGDTMYDYNAEKRRVFVEGYEQGYKDAVIKACEWLRRTQPQVILPDTTIERFKQRLEEQL